jgi:transcriptional regulator with XRE-family HTH domain
MDIKEIFAESLKKELKKRGITQKEISVKAHISSAYISQIIKGKRTPTITVAKSIADALNEPLSYLLGESIGIKTLPENKNLTEDDLKAIETFIDYILAKKNND